MIIASQPPPGGLVRFDFRCGDRCHVCHPRSPVRAPGAPGSTTGDRHDADVRGPPKQPRVRVAAGYGLRARGAIALSGPPHWRKALCAPVERHAPEPLFLLLLFEVSE